MKLVKLSDRITINFDNVAYFLDEDVPPCGATLEEGKKNAEVSKKMSIIFIGQIRLDLTEDERLELLKYCEETSPGFNQWVYYTISQIAKFVRITPKQCIEILSNCGYVDYRSGAYVIWNSGEAAGGIHCDLPHDNFGLMFKGSLIDDRRFKECLNDLYK